MPTVYNKSVTEKWEGNKKEIYLCLSIVESDLVRFPGDKNKVQKDLGPVQTLYFAWAEGNSN